MTRNESVPRSLLQQNSRTIFVLLCEHTVTWRITAILEDSIIFFLFFLPRIHSIQCTNYLLLDKSCRYTKYSYFAWINSLYKYMYRYASVLSKSDISYQFRYVVQFTDLDECFSIIILCKNTVCMISYYCARFDFWVNIAHISQKLLYEATLDAYHKMFYLTIAKFKWNFPTEPISLPRNKRI